MDIPIFKPWVSSLPRLYVWLEHLVKHDTNPLPGAGDSRVHKNQVDDALIALEMVKEAIKLSEQAKSGKLDSEEIDELLELTFKLGEQTTLIQTRYPELLAAKGISAFEGRSKGGRTGDLSEEEQETALKVIDQVFEKHSRGSKKKLSKTKAFVQAIPILREEHKIIASHDVLMRLMRKQK
jgi:hypothetical protein